MTGINFIGMLSHKGGIGNAARMNLREVKKLGLPVSWLDFPGEKSRDPRKLADPPHNLNIFHFNPESVSLHALMECRWFGYRNILYAAWETTQVPDDWIAWDRWIDVLWVPSEFTRNAFIKSGWKGRIDVVPHFVQSVHRRATSMHQPDITTLRLMVSFDAKSRIERKLPHLAMAAAIVGAKRMGVEADVVLKTHDCPKADIHRILQKTSDLVVAHVKDGNRQAEVTVHSEWMGEAELAVLIASCHGIISMNRGEGFGLPGIEAMAIGLPVIWTNWGGSTQYLTTDNCYPIEPVGIIPVANDGYFRTGSWAEPSFLAAVQRVMDLVADIRSGHVNTVIGEGYRTAEYFNPDRVRELMQASISRIL